MKEFVVKPGERFDVMVSGPNPSLADPAGLIGSTTFEFVAGHSPEWEPKPGWLERQGRRVQENVASWPQWMRDAGKK